MSRGQAHRDVVMSVVYECKHPWAAKHSGVIQSWPGQTSACELKRGKKAKGIDIKASARSKVTYVCFEDRYS